ncbi:MAG: DUF2384 domain-containing protein [Planctomycetaceae bacterium]|nr:DUF2384 domain-containing protein [Planctomycetaceae bacterium]
MSPSDSDLLFRLAQVYVAAVDLFGQREDAWEWLMADSVTLGNAAPYRLIATTVGYETVLEELQRLQYGIAG